MLTFPLFPHKSRQVEPTGQNSPKSTTSPVYMYDRAKKLRFMANLKHWFCLSNSPPGDCVTQNSILHIKCGWRCHSHNLVGSGHSNARAIIIIGGTPTKNGDRSWNLDRRKLPKRVNIVVFIAKPDPCAKRIWTTSIRRQTEVFNE